MAGLVLAAVLLTAAPVRAHHGWSGYDQSKELTLDGTITQSGYEHPHGPVASLILWVGVITAGRLLAYL